MRSPLLQGEEILFFSIVMLLGYILFIIVLGAQNMICKTKVTHFHDVCRIWVIVDCSNSFFWESLTKLNLKLVMFCLLHMLIL